MPKETSLASLRNQTSVSPVSQPNTKPSLHDSEGPEDEREQPEGLDVGVMLTAHHKVKEKHHRKMATHHESMAKDHEKMAEHHQKQHEELTKEGY